MASTLIPLKKIYNYNFLDITTLITLFTLFTYVLVLHVSRP